jgi:hypothetical protein
LRTDATNDTLTPRSRRSATRGAEHFEGLGFNERAGFHFVIVEAAEYGVWSILNNLSKLLLRTGFINT